MKAIAVWIALGLIAAGCASDTADSGSLPPDTGLTGIGGPGTGGTTGSGAGTSGVGVDRLRTTGTGTITSQTPVRVIGDL